MPCAPIDLTLPDGPSGPAIPGFGIPFALKLPTDLFKLPEGFPEDLLDLLNKLQFLLPPGAIKPALNLNYGKDIFDAIMKLLDQFFPFLMLYKFFLPLLNLIICIIEVLCALKNPFKLIRAIRRLFRKCLPAFLNLFPIFALIAMLISLLLLLLALIEYIIAQILKLIKAILRNIKALIKAVTRADQESILAIAVKLGNLLCIFQNLFVLLALFSTIIQVIKDILSVSISIPPCDDSDTGSAGGADGETVPPIDKCCTPDVCPGIVKVNYTNTTGNLQYLNAVQYANIIPGLPAGLPLFATQLTIDVRKQSYQIYDDFQTIDQAFINIINAHDVDPAIFGTKPVFFPTDVTYTAQTNPKQAAYTVDLRLLYNPASWGRSGVAQYIRFTDCIVLNVPTIYLSDYQNTPIPHTGGVLLLAGGLGFLDDGVTPITGFNPDNTPSTAQATLENLLFKPPVLNSLPVLLPTDGYTFTNLEYTFKPNLPVLFSKDIITAGCLPDLNLDKNFVNIIFAGDVNVKFGQLSSLIKSDGSGDLVDSNGNAIDGLFPNPSKAQECLALALAGLRSNMTVEGVATFQSTATVCLNKLKADTTAALNSLIGIGFDSRKSDLTLDPNVQFTTKSIKVKVDLRESNNQPVCLNLPAEIATNIASRLSPTVTFGNVSPLQYDGSRYFITEITSENTGSGVIGMSFDNVQFSVVTLPLDLNVAPTNLPKLLSYQFVQTPHGLVIPVVSTGTGDTEGEPRRDEGDVSRTGNS